MNIKEFVVFLGMILLCCGVAVAGISFIDPTPINNSRIYVNYTNINVSIPADNLTNFTFNWNGTNTTYLNDSCVLHLSFDNNSEIGDSSTVVRDVSSYNNNGSFVNGSTGNWTIDGKWNGAMCFDGVDDYVDCGNLGNLPVKGTISMWVNGKKEDYRNIFCTQLATNTGIRSQVYSSGRWTVVYGSAGTHELPSFVPYVWHHLVICWNTSANTTSIYLDNTKVIDEASETVFPATIPDFRIGDGYDTNSIRKWEGSIDEVRIYNRALSPAEVRQSYFSNLWKFNESQWYFETNQTDLIDGEYNYQGFANNITNNYITDYRLLFVGYESTFIPPNPINITNITGDNWIKHLWDTGMGNITDSYNISANNIWYNTTINTYYQKTYTLDTWQNITVYAYNSSGNGTLSSGNISQNTFLTYTSPNSFSETVEIIEDFPQASTNILTSFLLFLPLFVGILISAALILVCVGVFGKLKQW